MAVRHSVNEVTSPQLNNNISAISYHGGGGAGVIAGAAFSTAGVKAPNLTKFVKSINTGWQQKCMLVSWQESKWLLFVLKSFEDWKRDMLWLFSVIFKVVPHPSVCWRRLIVDVENHSIKAGCSKQAPVEKSENCLDFFWHAHHILALISISAPA